MTRTSHTQNAYYSGPVSDHFDGLKFYNPHGVPPGRFGDLLKWQMTEKRAKWPAVSESEYHGSVPKNRVMGRGLEVTMIGHATLLIQVNGLNLITDPVFSQRASPFQLIGPRRVNPPGVSFEDLPKIDTVLLSHNHYDHLDLVTLSKLIQRDQPNIVTPLGNDAIIYKAVPGATIHTGDWGDRIDISNDTRVHIEPCHHWSARGTRDRQMALWAAFVIETEGLRIYHVGDTGFHSGINYMQAVAKHGSFDLAILPIGAYEPRWFMKGQHQNPAEAVEGFRLCNAKQAIGHHWGTFQLTNEPIEEPKELLNAALQQQGIDHDCFIAMHPGQVWQL